MIPILFIDMLLTAYFVFRYLTEKDPNSAGIAVLGFMAFIGTIGVNIVDKVEELSKRLPER